VRVGRLSQGSTATFTRAAIYRFFRRLTWAHLHRASQGYRMRVSPPTARAISVHVRRWFTNAYVSAACAASTCTACRQPLPALSSLHTPQASGSSVPSLEPRVCFRSGALPLPRAVSLVRPVGVATASSTLSNPRGLTPLWSSFVSFVRFLRAPCAHHCAARIRAFLKPRTVNRHVCVPRCRNRMRCTHSHAQDGFVCNFLHRHPLLAYCVISHTRGSGHRLYVSYALDWL
jgi:hypothetical protein